MQEKIAVNLTNIKQRIEEIASDNNVNSEEVKIIAVSKKKDFSLIKIANNLGVKDFGENYAQELKTKAEMVNDEEISWHFIGPIQSNKVKLIAKHAHWVHALDREKIIFKLNDECEKQSKLINGFIQVNISSEDSKSGCNPDNFIELAKLIKSMKNINLKGIMALPKLTDNRLDRMETMNKVMNLSNKLKGHFPEAKYISMGTSSDFEDAVSVGSNVIRLGESIFGKRL